MKRRCTQEKVLLAALTPPPSKSLLILKLSTFFNGALKQPHLHRIPVNCAQCLFDSAQDISSFSGSCPSRDSVFAVAPLQQIKSLEISNCVTPASRMVSSAIHQTDFFLPNDVIVVICLLHFCQESSQDSKADTFMTECSLCKKTLTSPDAEKQHYKKCMQRITRAIKVIVP